MLKDKLKYKIGDTIVVLGRCPECSVTSKNTCKEAAIEGKCKGSIGTIVSENGVHKEDLEKGRYPVKFPTDTKHSWCEFGESEIRLATEKDIDRYWLMRFAHV